MLVEYFDRLEVVGLDAATLKRASQINHPEAFSEARYEMSRDDVEGFDAIIHLHFQTIRWES